MKRYAYVSAECCTMIRAFRPGEEYQDVPVSKHGDLLPWCYGKRETLRLMDHGSTRYMRGAARKVAWLLQWSMLLAALLAPAMAQETTRHYPLTLSVQSAAGERTYLSGLECGQRAVPSRIESRGPQGGFEFSAELIEVDEAAAVVKNDLRYSAAAETVRTIRALPIRFGEDVWVFHSDAFKLALRVDRPVPPPPPAIHCSACHRSMR